jgi:hypothetical protein
MNTLTGASSAYCLKMRKLIGNVQWSDLKVKSDLKEPSYNGSAQKIVSNMEFQGKLKISRGVIVKSHSIN